MIATFVTLHCAPTKRAAENLRREGVVIGKIHVTGNTVVDALLWTQERLEERPELAGRMVEIERRFDDCMIVAVTCHRRENAGHGFAEVLKAVAGLSSQRCLGLVFQVHPAFSRDVEMSGLAASANAALLGPLHYPDFIRLLAISSVVITDSGRIQEEAPVLGVPVLVTCEITERPEGVAPGATRIVECSSSAIEREVHRIICETTRSPSTDDAFLEYGQCASAQLIVGLIARESCRPSLGARAR